MKIGTSIAICGIWLGCGLSTFSGNVTGEVFAGATLATIFTVLFSRD